MIEETNKATVCRVKELLDYDPKTGSFTRKVKTSNRAPVGPVAGTLNSEGYLRIGIDGQRYYAHRLAWVLAHGEWPEHVIDHINGDRTDNRLCNLRAATNQQNGRNRPKQKSNTSGYKGVSYYKNGYCAKITVNGKLIHLGRRKAPEEAYDLYVEASKKLFGDFHHNS